MQKKDTKPESETVRDITVGVTKYTQTPLTTATINPDNKDNYHKSTITSKVINSSNTLERCYLKRSSKLPVKVPISTAVKVGSLLGD